MSNPTPTSTTEPFLIEKLYGPFDAQITLPGSKSIALRQLAIAALCSGSTHLTGVPDCDDSAADFPDNAQLCGKCQTKAMVLMDGCLTCLHCGDSKCG